MVGPVNVLWGNQWQKVYIILGEDPLRKCIKNFREQIARVQVVWGSRLKCYNFKRKKKNLLQLGGQ